jgi:hypothetical protein
VERVIFLAVVGALAIALIVAGFVLVKILRACEDPDELRRR